MKNEPCFILFDIEHILYFITENTNKVIFTVLNEYYTDKKIYETYPLIDVHHSISLIKDLKIREMLKLRMRYSSIELSPNIKDTSAYLSNRFNSIEEAKAWYIIEKYNKLYNELQHYKTKNNYKKYCEQTINSKKFLAKYKEYSEKYPELLF